MLTDLLSSLHCCDREQHVFASQLSYHYTPLRYTQNTHSRRIMKAHLIVLIVHRAPSVILGDRTIHHVIVAAGMMAWVVRTTPIYQVPKVVRWIHKSHRRQRAYHVSRDRKYSNNRPPGSLWMQSVT